MGANGELWGSASDPSPITLYEWQEEAVAQLRRNLSGGMLRQILVSPTGSGKTVLAAYLMEQANKKRRRAAFLCDRLSLIDQTSGLFDQYGIDHGILQGDHWRYDPVRRIQVASVQTLAKRRIPTDLDLLVVDECHTRYKHVSEYIRRCGIPVLGLTATPFSPGLGLDFEGVVNVRTMNQLAEAGYLAPFDVYAPEEMDMSGAKLDRHGEWRAKDAEKAALPIVGDAVAEYLKHGAGGKFLCFGVTIKHCEELHRQFMAAGIQTALYTADTGPERAMIARDFRDKNGYLRGLISVAALSKGFDAPCVRVVIMCRPLRKSFTEYIQVLGRGLRRDPEDPAKRCIVLDHTGNTRRFWRRMHDFFEHGVHALDDGKPKPKQDREPEEPEPLRCPQCAYLHKPRPACPKCGFEYPRRASGVVHVPGKLNPLTGLPVGTRGDRQAVFSGLLWLAEYGKPPRKRGWAAYMYKERYGCWPNQDRLLEEARHPTRELESWVTGRMLRRVHAIRAEEKKARKKAGF